MWKPWNASGLVRPDSGSSENGAIRNCRSGRARSGRDFNHVPTSYVAAAIGPEREKKYCPTERSSRQPPKLGFCESGLPSRSEEHTSELQSLMRISYAVFCLKKNNRHKQPTTTNQTITLTTYVT